MLLAAGAALTPFRCLRRELSTPVLLLMEDALGPPYDNINS